MVLRPEERWNACGGDGAAEERALERFFRACEIAKFDADTKLIYEKDMITERDYYNIINTARKTGKTEGMSAGMLKGFQKGREEGLNEGLRQGMESGLKKGILEGQSKERTNIAKTMKAMNMSIDVIAKATGLSETEIAAL